LNINNVYTQAILNKHNYFYENDSQTTIIFLQKMHLRVLCPLLANTTPIIQKIGSFLSDEERLFLAKASIQLKKQVLSFPFQISVPVNDLRSLSLFLAGSALPSLGLNVDLRKIYAPFEHLEPFFSKITHLNIESPIFNLEWNLPKLQHLKLTNSLIELDNWVNLASLYVKGSWVKFNPEGQFLTRLLNLTLEECKVGDLLEKIHFIPNLQRLVCIDLELGFKNLFPLLSLRELYLKSSKEHTFTNLDFLINYPFLEKLLVKRVKMLNINGLKHCPSLRQLKLDIVKNLDLTVILALPLTKLSLTNSLINVTGIVFPPQIKALVIKECKVIGSLIFAPSSKLTYLNLFNSAYVKLCYSGATREAILKSGVEVPTSLTKLVISKTIFSCVTLKELHIHGSTTRSLVKIKGCVNLEKLTLKFCKELRDIEAVKSFPLLQEIYLEHCHNLGKISSLSSCPNLTKISLFSCGVSNIKKLALCPKLKELYLRNVYFPDRLASFEGYATLEILSIKNKFLNHDDLTTLRGCPQLKVLILTGSVGAENISALATCPNLGYVKIVTSVPLKREPIGELTRVTVKMVIDDDEGQLFHFEARKPGLAGYELSLNYSDK
jgi:hypothetical protein